MSQATIPNAEIPATGGKFVNLQNQKGIYVLYFYPKDATPGCTQEGRDFSRLYKSFQSESCEVFGVSKDSIASHEKFKAKEKYPFPLLSDPEEKLCKAFQTLKEKISFGKKRMGLERSSFVVRSGQILKEWRKVKVSGHAQEVLDFVKNLSGK